MLTGRAESVCPCCLLLGRAGTELLLPRLHLEEIHPWLEAFNLSDVKHFSWENLLALLLSAFVSQLFPGSSAHLAAEQTAVKRITEDLLLIAFVESNGWVEGTATAWIGVSLSPCRVGAVCVHL